MLKGARINLLCPGYNQVILQLNSQRNLYLASLYTFIATADASPANLYLISWDSLLPSKYYHLLRFYFAGTVTIVSKRYTHEVDRRSFSAQPFNFFVVGNGSVGSQLRKGE